MMFEIRIKMSNRVMYKTYSYSYFNFLVVIAFCSCLLSILHLQCFQNLLCIYTMNTVTIETVKTCILFYMQHVCKIVMFSFATLGSLGRYAIPYTMQ